MSEVIVFAGTTEGRELAAFLNSYGISSVICTATEYGSCRIPSGDHLSVRSGRMEAWEMAGLFAQEQPELVIDATHPYASLVSKNIREACLRENREYVRLCRPASAEDPSWIRAENAAAAAAYLAAHPGRALITTGSKELSAYTVVPDYRERLWVRVLPDPDVLARCRELGFDAGHIIAMQGPFSEELNRELLRSIGAACLVTKESGQNGGFGEKARAAKEAGAALLVIGRPAEEPGTELPAVKRLVIRRFRLAARRSVTIAGIGMGSPEQMTGEVCHACRQAELLIGARRMLEAAERFHKPSYCAYDPQAIASYVEEHPEYERIVVLLSGDSGFYSGAKKLIGCFGQEQTRVLPGISAVSYLAARLGVSWEDACLLSLHGRSANYVDAVKRNRRVFCLCGGKDSVREVCEKLLYYDFAELRVTAASNLSYPEERIVSGTPREVLEQEISDLSVLLIENPGAAARPAPGYPDDVFERGKTPMTKRTVRCAALSYLGLAPDSVVWDVGAGTGSVSVEMAEQAYEGAVYAVEKDPEAAALLERNRRRFAADNLRIVRGRAPEALEGLPSPTHVFIGGSAGHLEEILRTLLQKNPEVRVVLTAVTLETIREAVRCLVPPDFAGLEVLCLQASEARPVGSLHLMTAQNPVYLFCAKGGGRA